jgi:hypothetical protein
MELWLAIRSIVPLGRGYFPDDSRHFVPGYYRAVPPGQNHRVSLGTESRVTPGLCDLGPSGRRKQTLRSKKGKRPKAAFSPNSAIRNPQFLSLLFLGFFLGFFLGRGFHGRFCAWQIHKFEVSHECGVALSGTKFHDAAISAMAACGPRRDFGKQSVHGFLLPQKRKRHPACMEITPLAQSDHPFGKRPNGLCFCQSRLDSIVGDEATNLIRQQKIPMLGFAAQLDRFLCVTHKLLERDQFPLVAPFASHGRFNQS